MKLKMVQVINAYNWANQLSGDNALTYKAAFLISANAKGMSDVVQSFEEQRTAIIDKYSEKDAKGNVKKTKDGSTKFTDEAKCNEEITSLINCEVEVTITKIPISEMQGLSVSLGQMVAIDFLFDPEA